MSSRGSSPNRSSRGGEPGLSQAAGKSDHDWCHGERKDASCHRAQKKAPWRRGEGALLSGPGEVQKRTWLGEALTVDKPEATASCGCQPGGSS